MADIKIGDDAAVMGGVHSDSHDVHNNMTNNTTNNSTVYNTSTSKTVYEAQKTQTEILQDNENQFLLAVQERFADGILDQRELAELNQLSIQWHIPPMRANQIIEQVRQSASILQGGQGNEFLASQILQEVFNAIQINQTDILRRKFRTLEQLARTSADSNVQFYYNLLLAAFSPENSTVAFMNSRVDNYWQLFWAHVAYVKLGNVDNGIVLLPRLGGFGCPQGDTALLMAIDNIADYRNNGGQEYYIQQAQQYLEEASRLGMSEPLGGLWYGAKECLSDLPQPEDWYRFYVETVLKELGPAKTISKPVASAPKVPTPPPVPKFNAQSVNLTQMQGFNPLQAARQMGIGKPVPSMNQSFGQMVSPPPMPASQPVPPPLPSMVQPTMMSSQQDVTLEPVPSVPQYGILFTDSVKLAMKYHCQHSQVIEVLTIFAEQSAEHQMNWYLLDAAQHKIRLGDSDFWLDYNELLSEYMQDSGFSYGLQTPLFIIGGDDVIPIPMVEDPYGTSDRIPCDMCYGFQGNFFSDLWDSGDHSVSEAYVRNTVSRLPLEDGEMSSTIEEDLLSYFNICSLYYAEGIPVQHVMMTSNASWLPASKTMSEHLPLVHHTDDPQFVQHGMFVSPPISPDNEQCTVPVKQSLSDSGMLLFNLHGSDSEEYSGFYSDRDEAFSIGMLSDTDARVFNTVACFGARYHGYKRNASMLLNAFYRHGFLLYAGSLIPVPMCEISAPEGVEVHPGSGSEHLMPIYCMEQFGGLAAGEAMMKAKLEYFNTFRQLERDDFSLATMMMFSLYGNPMLRMQRCEEVLQRAAQENVLPQIPSAKALAAIPIRMKRTQTLLTKHQLQGKSLIDQVRSFVDGNIAAIHQLVLQNLYQALGLDPRWLHQVDAYSIPRGDGSFETGYIYAFEDETKKFGSKTWAEVDMKGNITRLTTIK